MPDSPYWFSEMKGRGRGEPLPLAAMTSDLIAFAF